MQDHARLSRALKQKARARADAYQQRKFKADKHKALFEKKSGGEPEFPQEKGFEYFSNLYRDEKRHEAVDPLPEMKSPSPPSRLFSQKPPSQKEIEDAIHRKRNGAAPGLDGITYVPYKRCPALLPVLVKLFEKIWQTNDVPSNWAAASIQLLAKSDKLTEPAEFRPIALTNTIGKVFFAVIAKRLEDFMLTNKYISTSQKGFKAGTPGCLEHSFAMFEALFDAKSHYRQIVVAWLDLKNAYGSVRHNLIQFALSWFRQK